MKKLNSALVLVVLVVGFLTLNFFLAQSQGTLGYDERINLIEAKLVNHETRIVKLERTPVATTATTAQNGQWQRPDGNGWWFPKDGDFVTRSSSGKVHFWCQWMNPMSKLTWAECKAKFGSTESDLCTLCTQHLVPPGGVNPQKAPANVEKQANAKASTQGNVKK
jgi:hypothetical protein